MNTELKTRKEWMDSGVLDGYDNFLGDDSEFQDWYVLPVLLHRDADVLAESNFYSALHMLGGENENVRVDRYGHWAVGWIEQITVRPDTPAACTAKMIAESLNQYPILDEEYFSRREYERAKEIWQEVFDNQDRIQFLREHKDDIPDVYDWKLMFRLSKGEFTINLPIEILAE